MRRALTLAAATGALLVAFSSPASARSVLDDFKGDGRINPCQYTDDQLRRGLNNLPPDIEQYAPGLAEQLGAGREGCGGGQQAIPQANETQAVSAPVSTPKPPAPDVPAPPAPKAGKRSRLAGVSSPAVSAVPTGSDAPAWLLPFLLLVGGGLGLGALGRYRGWSAERFTRPLKASLAEAGGRGSDALAVARDSVRTGR
jgi:hypothetical protein